MWKKRLRRVMGRAGLFLAAGAGYGMFVQKTGLAVPCPFHLLTGLQCPGCGVTRMCIALMQLDFEAAFYSNQALFFVSPALGIVFLIYVIGYVRNGTWHMGRVQSGIICICIALLVLFGVLRNIFPL